MEKAKQIKEFEEKVIEINRVSRTVKGGRRLRFRALVAIGNRKGKVGFGLGKANEVAVAVTKAVKEANKNIIEVPIVNDTIPCEIKFNYGSACVFLKPAAPGTSVIAGGSVRVIIELAGIKNILSKIYGSSNKINNVVATFLALQELKKFAAPDTKYSSAKSLSSKPMIEPKIKDDSTDDKIQASTDLKEKNNA